MHPMGRRAGRYHLEVWLGYGPADKLRARAVHPGHPKSVTYMVKMLGASRSSPAGFF
jgi:hypothetical protein